MKNIFLLLIFYAYSLPQCTNENIGYTFSDCSEILYTRSAFFYWQEECENGLSILHPISNLPCDVSWPAGQYLDLDLDHQTSICCDWPANTYSTGGAKRIDGQQVKWTEQFSSLFNSFWAVWQTGTNEWVKNHQCTSWGPAPDGSKLTTGTTGLQTVIHDQLTATLNLKEPGEFKMKYSKDTKVLQDRLNGIFTVIVNGESWEDTEMIVDTWQYFNSTLNEGINEIIISYVRYNVEGYNELNAEIEMIQIDGLALSDTQWYPCVHGFSAPGSSDCSICPAHTYLAQDVDTPEISCLACPSGMYSFTGSIGIDDWHQQNPCTADDYYVQYSQCSQGTRDRLFNWNSPKICSHETGVDLPPIESGVDWEECQPGFVYRDDGCTPCPSGTISTTNQCIPCDAGTHAPKQILYNVWTPLPSNFENTCRTLKGHPCPIRNGWLTKYDRLHSGYDISEDIDLILTLVVEIVDPKAYIQFKYSLEKPKMSQSRLGVSINGQSTYWQQSETEALSDSYSLQVGSNIIKWNYNHRTSISNEDSCSIHYVFIYGLEHGGSESCRRCLPGHYSYPSSAICYACSPGSTSSPDLTSCIDCTDNTYTDLVGDSEGCMDCPGNTLPNYNHTACIGHDIMSFANYTVYINNLSGIVEGQDGYNQGIWSKDKNALYWHQTYYGPISGEQGFYYLSILNPSWFGLEGFYNLDTLFKGYAFGVIKKEFLPDHQQKAQAQPDQCTSDSLIVNLGSRVSEISKTEQGFSIAYEFGSVCSIASESAYSTKVNFICDKSADEGWPELGEVDRCTVNFNWRTIYAWTIWSTRDMIKIESRCEDKARKISILEGDECIILNHTLYGGYEEECSVTYELFENIYVLILAGVIVGIAIAVIIMCCCLCRVKSKYHKLQEYRQNVTVYEEDEKSSPPEVVN